MSTAENNLFPNTMPVQASTTTISIPLSLKENMVSLTWMGKEREKEVNMNQTTILLHSVLINHILV